MTCLMKREAGKDTISLVHKPEHKQKQVDKEGDFLQRVYCSS